MKKFSFSLPIALLALLFFSCKKEFTESVFSIVLIEGDGQTGDPNTPLSSEIVVQVLRDGKAFFSAPIIFEPNSGFATASGQAQFSQKVAATDGAGKVRINWTLGCLGSQEMKIRLGSPGCSQAELVSGTCETLGELTVHAEATAAGGWTKACGFQNFFVNFDRFATQFMEFGDALFVLVNNNVFTSHNDGVDWEPVNTPFGPNASFTSAFSVGPNGDYYMAIFSNGVFTSKDRGASWTNITNNIFFSQPNKIFIRGDVMLVNDQGNGLFRTENNGASWSQVNVGGTFFGNFREIVETPDGKFWTWDENNARLAKSSDQGKTWSSVNVSSGLQAFPASYMNATADGHILYLYQNGAKLLDYNPATNTGTVKSFVNNPSGASFVGFLQHFSDGSNWLNTYVNGGLSLGIHAGIGNSNYDKVEPGTTEDTEVFYRTKNERLLIGNKNGLFVKI